MIIKTEGYRTSLSVQEAFDKLIEGSWCADKPLGILRPDEGFHCSDFRILLQEVDETSFTVHFDCIVHPYMPKETHASNFSLTSERFSATIVGVLNPASGGSIIHLETEATPGKPAFSTERDARAYCLKAIAKQTINPVVTTDEMTAKKKRGETVKMSGLLIFEIAAVLLIIFVLFAFASSCSTPDHSDYLNSAQGAADFGSWLGANKGL